MTESEIAKLARETHDKLKALCPCLSEDCLGCQTERNLILAALQQVRALDLQIVEQLAQCDIEQDFGDGPVVTGPWVSRYAVLSALRDEAVNTGKIKGNQ